MLFVGAGALYHTAFRKPILELRIHRRSPVMPDTSTYYRSGGDSSVAGSCNSPERDCQGSRLGMKRQSRERMPKSWCLDLHHHNKPSSRVHANRKNNNNTQVMCKSIHSFLSPKSYHMEYVRKEKKISKKRHAHAVSHPAQQYPPPALTYVFYSCASTCPQNELLLGPSFSSLLYDVPQYVNNFPSARPSFCCVENAQCISLMLTTSYVPSWLALTTLV